MTSTMAATEQLASTRPRPSLGLVIVASSGGTLIEWYDFYLYASMGAYLGTLFFPQSAHQGMLGLLFSMATVGIGMAIRPLGGLVFGSLGDRLGRKYSFLFTLLLMGFATTCMGLLPVYQAIGYLAPAALLILRILQGLAAGGEVGGAVSYVVENAPQSQRGWFVGILYAMSPLGTLLSLAVVYVCSAAIGAEDFAAWGWRIPFLLSGVLVIVSLYFRLRLQETAAFEALLQSHQEAKSPIRELFSTRENVIRVLLAVFGSTAGQAALGSVALVYAPSFMQAVLKIDIRTSSSIAILAVLLALSVIPPVRLGVRPRRPASNDHSRHLPGDCFLWPDLSRHAGRVRTATILVAGILQLGCKSFSWRSCFPLRLPHWQSCFRHGLRSTGTGVTYNLSNGLLNGFAPLIGFGLFAATGNIYAALAYPMVLAAITASVSFWFIKETYRSNLP